MVRSDFGKKYGAVGKYGIIYSVLYTFRTPVTHALHICFHVLRFPSSYDFTPSVALAAHAHHESPLTILSNNVVNKLNCYVIITIRLFNNNPGYSEAQSRIKGGGGLWGL